MGNDHLALTQTTYFNANYNVLFYIHSVLFKKEIKSHTYKLFFEDNKTSWQLPKAYYFFFTGTHLKATFFIHTMQQQNV